MHPYDKFIPEFLATVTSCAENKNGKFDVTLDETRFFFEGGGQPADHGTIGDVLVSDVQEKDGKIIHECNAPLTVGERYNCTIDVMRRKDLTEQHSGEHILSGLICRKFNANNVGFHISDDVVTVDFDVAITKEDASEAEREANEVVRANAEVKILYPAESELKTLPYRSKKELTGEVRLVEYPNADLCACCGTHVTRTGEIGIIKILSVQNYKGGVRISMISGERAFNDYCNKHSDISSLAVKNSCKTSEVVGAIERLEQTVSDLKLKLQKSQQTYFDAVRDMSGDAPKIVIVNEDIDVQKFALTLATRAKVSAVLCGKDGDYRFALASQSVDLSKVRQSWNDGVDGKGGGQPALLTGKCACDSDTAKKVFEELFNQ